MANAAGGILGGFAVERSLSKTAIADQAGQLRCGPEGAGDDAR